MITVFSKDGCGYCDKIKAILKDYKVPHIVKNLDIDYSLEDIKNKVSKAKGEDVQRLTFPAVFDQETYIGGCDDMMDYMLEHKMV